MWPFYGWLFHCMVGHISFLSLSLLFGWVFLLLWIMLLWRFLYKFLYERMFSILSRVDTEEWNCWVVGALCLTVWGMARLFSTAAVPFHIPASSVGGSRDLTCNTESKNQQWDQGRYQLGYHHEVRIGAAGEASGLVGPRLASRSAWGSELPNKTRNRSFIKSWLF